MSRSILDELADVLRAPQNENDPATRRLLVRAGLGLVRLLSTGLLP